MIGIDDFAGYPDDGKVRLVEKVSDVAGFYVCDSDPIYATPSARNNIGCKETETSFLKLWIGAKLQPISPDGACLVDEVRDFDIIRLVNWRSIEERNRFFESFIELCKMHASQEPDLTFEDFFYSLTELFQPNKEQSKLNAYGLFSELAFIDEISSTMPNLDITENWQFDGPNSKYDFVFPLGNVEVKSSTREYEVIIKHDQLFNEDDNSLVAVSIEKNSSGENLIDLVERLAKKNNCFQSLRSRIELHRRMLQIDIRDLKKRFQVASIRCFLGRDINFFEDFSDRVTDLNYRLDLTDMEYLPSSILIAKLI